MDEFQEKERLYQFLMGLDAESYVIKTQILATKPISTLGNTYSLVAEDERKRSVSNDKRVQPEAAEFKAFQRKDGNHNTFKEKNLTRTSKDNKEGKENDHFTFCGKNGHKREGCSRLVGYPEWWLGKKEKGKPRAAHIEPQSSPIPELTYEQYQLLVKHSENNDQEVTPRVANMTGKEGSKGEWIVDSGCTEHITFLPSLL